jgi:nicotinamide-nucleotide amidase
MTAWIVAVGSELLTPFHVDTNSLVITERLNAIGCRVTRKLVVGDDAVELSRVLAGAVGEVDLVVCTGGLGPTADDVTRDALAGALGLPLDADEEVARAIRARFARRGVPMPEINMRQALVPRGAIVLQNEHGTAPGLWLDRPPTRFLLLPGPAREMTPLLERAVATHVASLSDGTRLVRRVVKVAGRPESDVDARAQPVYARWASQDVPIETTILASPGLVELHLTAREGQGQDAAAALDAAVGELRRALGASVFSDDRRSLEEVVGALLGSTRQTLAVAESCTGGLLTSRLTDVPGSSAYLNRSAVCYSNLAKIEWLSVPEALIAEHGAVSEPVARAMAEGVRAAAGADLGLAVTGIAGPGGGSAEKPVGTVAIAVVAGRREHVETFHFAGGRAQVKEQATRAGLNLLRQFLLDTVRPSD